MQIPSSGKTDSGCTKFTSMIHYRGGGDLSDATRLYRKEEALKKRLKTVLESNSQLQKQIRNHQIEIKDERASVQFQLNDLLKEMGLKFSCFTEQKLEKKGFGTNEQAHQSIQQMIQKYQQIQKECHMMSKIFDSIVKINRNYTVHSSQMEKMVIQSESVTQAYQRQMEQTIEQNCQETRLKMKENQECDNNTQELVKQIDQYVENMYFLKEQEEKVMAKVEKLKKMANCQQKKVDQISEWAEIVIDKSNRKAVQKTMKEKQKCLDRMKQQNDQLEIYLHQLENQEAELLRNKQNQNQISTAKSTRRTNKKSKPTKSVKII